MHISKIKLTNFKNFSEQDFNLINGFNFIVGPNGQGKSNVLDAIYNSCFAKSYLLIPDADLVKYETDFYRTEAMVQMQDSSKKVVVNYQKGKKKKIEYNGQSILKYSSHIGHIVCVMIAPDEQKIVQGSSEERRKLIDNALSQIDAIYLEKAIQYQKVLEQRNALLKNREQSDASTTNQLFDIYNKQLSEFAGYIFQKRKAFIEEISIYFQEYYSAIVERNEAISFVYETDLHSELLYDILQKCFEKDKILEYTSKGIHKDDIKIVIQNNPLKKFASQGQQKTFIIALKLAICKYLYQRKKDKIILLIDDLFDKLDEIRSEELLKLLLNKDFFTQVIFTDTNRKRIESILLKMQAEKYTKIKFFEINQLSVKEVDYN